CREQRPTTQGDMCLGQRDSDAVVGVSSPRSEVARPGWPGQRPGLAILKIASQQSPPELASFAAMPPHDLGGAGALQMQATRNRSGGERNRQPWSACRSEAL